ncbi:MAG TPA: 4'-phosphopantetheinyl transferase superfamily protein [Sediminibacterium sp.]|uniref:4'-phosphopantetheinyl transferase family protein n=1 Tax=Sediminibacterium sp. TaxID=1917865 RepID=UPI0008AEABF7|nr:4'-phosphopantetheinyl transferase superfamily protein [Sediminibacterium sp.]MBT9483148.1 4'-phosphopantetheinyl transferase superfamily protein [Sediminibacterium sp.]OHC85275.1 MAG: 4-phosphopantetheinyl transferase [Sphingobacteriia bacterium RIFOXYC2_FULL_35_18]OHC89178.1 MAG: 4-phosphopantetheinyl transferase [Sphingobacteriia bacterium RIFOXYD2_FULL_35_12]HLD53559.1 4'-phosphopantetheinyl transferase superfamily protein [Sediminibacterium sp.]
MPIYYQQNINDFTQLAVWKIEEGESFFTQKVTIQQQVTHPHKRLQHLAGRFLLPYLFADFPSELIQIADTRKPYLPNEAYHFSISHCGDYAAAIVSSTERVGVDVELVTHRVNKIRHKFLHVSELTNWNIEAMEEQEKFRTLTLLWSAKEAMFKWWGRGDIDFSECMQVEAADLNSTGILKAFFRKDDFEANLQLHYRLTNELSLVWLNND